MKLLVVFAIVSVVAYASAAVTSEAYYDGPTFELKPIEGDADSDMADNADAAPIRQRRVTCDLLSWQSAWITINHSACAAKCIAQRRRGGTCRGGVCVCR